MQLSLRLSPSLQMTVDGKLEVELQGKTIRDCIEFGFEHYSGLKDILMKDEVMNPNLIFFHNNSVMKEGHLSRVINDGDILDVIPAIEAG